MLNNTFNYEQNSVRLSITGLPDKSLGQENDQIGILLSWKLTLLAYPELEGQKEHLLSFLNVIYSYTRNYISGVKEGYGNLEDPVSISPHNKVHKIQLRSSKDNISPLSIEIDDAELSDLLYTFDLMCNDPRLLINFDISPSRIISKSLLNNNTRKAFNLVAPLAGIASLLALSLLLFTIPLPEPPTPNIPTTKLGES
tara:strand:- start:2115 stop:2708 length:594 start_codon:yes stop_codon:yes gene_type:complete